MRRVAVHRGLVVAISAMVGLSWGCSRGRKDGVQSKAAAIVPGSPDCYKTEGASLCPSDPSDPSGRGLPRTGAVCTLADCKTCGSTGAPAYRDETGTAQSGWCICVEKSDGSGVRIYSCGQRGWGAN